MMTKTKFLTSVLLLVLLSSCRLPWGTPTTSSSKTSGNVSRTAPTSAAIENHIKTISSQGDFAQHVTNTDHKNRLTIVKFHADWCSACKTTKPVYDSVAHDLGQQYNFIVFDLAPKNKQVKKEAMSIAQKYGISGIPVIVFFKNGKEIGKRIVGTFKKETLVKTIEELSQ